MFSANEDEMRTPPPPEIIEMLKIPTNNLLSKKLCLSNIYELERKE
jgi:hypothetical protein